jgi:hypothetical protein
MVKPYMATWLAKNEKTEIWVMEPYIATWLVYNN